MIRITPEQHEGIQNLLDISNNNKAVAVMLHRSSVAHGGWGKKAERLHRLNDISADELRQGFIHGWDIVERFDTVIISAEQSVALSILELTAEDINRNLLDMHRDALARSGWSTRQLACLNQLSLHDVQQYHIGNYDVTRKTRILEEKRDGAELSQELIDIIEDWLVANWNEHPDKAYFLNQHRQAIQDGGIADNPAFNTLSTDTLGLALYYGVRPI